MILASGTDVPHVLPELVALAQQASEDGLDVIVGDYTKRAVLHEAGADRATLAVVADDELERTIHAVTAVRTLNPDATIVTRPLNTIDAEELAAAGADHVVTAERASHIGLQIAIRAALGAGTGATPLSTVIEFRPDPDAPCRHLAQIRVVQPSAYGCEDCLRINAAWVRLRICLSCGHVGCCDSSQHRHARKHAGAAAHPLIAGLEPGDEWAYCFLDEETIVPARFTQRRA